MVVSIHTNTPFVCIWGGGGATEQVCACIYMQYDPRTHWRTGEKRAYRAGAKSAAGRTYENDTFFHFPSTLWGIIHVDGGVIWPWYHISIIIWRHTSDCDINMYIYIYICIYTYACIYLHIHKYDIHANSDVLYICAHIYIHTYHIHANSGVRYIHIHI